MAGKPSYPDNACDLGRHQQRERHRTHRDRRKECDDARLTIARYYEFADWPSLTAYVEAVSQDGPFFEFESAVEAMADGDLAALEDALRYNPALVRARRDAQVHEFGESGPAWLLL